LAGSWDRCRSYVDGLDRQVEHAPFPKDGKELQDGIAERSGHCVLDMSHLPAQISPGDDPFFLHLTQALDQHLLCGLRNTPIQVVEREWESGRGSERTRSELGC
jgi:hypothetical protein